MDDARRDALEALLARLLETPAVVSLDSLKPGASPQDIKSALEAIPLPQRIALASRAGLKEREHLRLDANPSVWKRSRTIRTWESPRRAHSPARRT
jgi:hypothetical protein